MKCADIQASFAYPTAANLEGTFVGTNQAVTDAWTKFTPPNEEYQLYYDPPLGVVDDPEGTSVATQYQVMAFNGPSRTAKSFELGFTFQTTATSYNGAIFSVAFVLNSEDGYYGGLRVHGSSDSSRTRLTINENLIYDSYYTESDETYSVKLKAFSDGSKNIYEWYVNDVLINRNTSGTYLIPFLDTFTVKDAFLRIAITRGSGLVPPIHKILSAYAIMEDNELDPPIPCADAFVYTNESVGLADDSGLAFSANIISCDVLAHIIDVLRDQDFACEIVPGVIDSLGIGLYSRYTNIVKGPFNFDLNDIVWNSPNDGITYNFSIEYYAAPDYITGSGLVSDGTISVTNGVPNFDNYTGDYTYNNIYGINIAGNRLGGFNATAYYDAEVATAGTIVDFLGCVDESCIPGDPLERCLFLPDDSTYSYQHDDGLYYRAELKGAAGKYAPGKETTSRFTCTWFLSISEYIDFRTFYDARKNDMMPFFIELIADRALFQDYVAKFDFNTFRITEQKGGSITVACDLDAYLRNKIAIVQQVKITEDGDIKITEDGDVKITEN